MRTILKNTEPRCRNGPKNGHPNVLHHNSANSSPIKSKIAPYESWDAQLSNGTCLDSKFDLVAKLWPKQSRSARLPHCKFACKFAMGQHRRPYQNELSRKPEWVPKMFCFITLVPVVRFQWTKYVSWSVHWAGFENANHFKKYRTAFLERVRILPPKCFVS